jgi:phosphoribosyl 1,2-cyclic phosphodiesterase
MNGYILQGETSSLIIEAGVPLLKAKQALNFDLSTVNGLILSHFHSDHAGRVKEYAAAGIDIYSNDETIAKADIHHRGHKMVDGFKYKIGEFTVMPFLLKHDVRNYGYLIQHKEMGLCLFITDTHYSPFVFPGLNNIIVECNYSDNVLDHNLETSKINPALANRIRKSHMSEDTMIGFLKANDTTQVNNIVIIHLSNGNSDAEQIVRRVTETTGIVPHIAKPGLKIDFNKTAF